ncbi:MAG: restriction endonuclease [Clostridia bacterium]|nr:restriction endonuclease [Clostridia bacterium]
MAAALTHSRIYRKIVEMLERAHLDRRDIISRCISIAGLTKDELSDRSAGSLQNGLRSRIGAVLNEMEARDLIAEDSDGLYYLVASRPVVIRIERCERELIKALSEKPMDKGEIRDRLKRIFGTDKTATTRDDDILMTFLGQLLKKLEALGVIKRSANEYSLSEKASARADDINSMLSLRDDYISRLHARGGEFFEGYFMELLKRYLEKHGKRVTECYVTGGSADGGIDGIAKTEDSLGFREIIMVQTKNRIEITSETEVRGFYGAVCAARGSRGIFVNTSDFHSSARAFLDGLDDCIGINGDRLFRIAIETKYGIRSLGGVLTVDDKII